MTTPSIPSMLTGSRLQLADTCPGSLAIPGWPSTSAVAEAGTAKHKFLADTMANGAEAALARVDPKWRDDCAKIDVDGLPAGAGGSWIAELPVAWDSVTGAVRVWPAGTDHRTVRAEAKPTEIIAIADFVGVDQPGGVVYVGDYKTGWSQQTPAKENLQLHFTAFALARHFGVAAAHVYICYTAGDSPRWDPAELDSLDLDDVEEKLNALMRKTAAAVRAWEEGKVDAIPFRTGDHCRYCKALPNCPAAAGLVRNALVAKPGPRAPLTPSMASFGYERLEAAEAACAAARRVLETYATAHPFQLSDGRVVGMTSGTADVLKADQVHAALLEAFPGTDVADRAAPMKRVATKGAIEDTLGALATALKERGEKMPDGSKVTKKAVVEETYRILRAAGAVVRVDTKPSVKAVDAGKCEGWEFVAFDPEARTQLVAALHYSFKEAGTIPVPPEAPDPEPREDPPQVAFPPPGDAKTAGAGPDVDPPAAAEGGDGPALAARKALVDQSATADDVDEVVAQVRGLTTDEAVALLEHGRLRKLALKGGKAARRKASKV